MLGLPRLVLTLAVAVGTIRPASAWAMARHVSNVLLLYINIYSDTFTDTDGTYNYKIEYILGSYERASSKN